ncbi:MAG: hypothetical protein HFE84_12270 [Lachnospiraceae bacterium]|nr:hypothetical protein [Lachnospiraceae bacterium]
MSELAKRFQKYKNKRVAVYGLGSEAEGVLKEIGGIVSVIGLLDSCRESGELYGFPILSLKEAIREQVELILVAARPGSCKAIARQIGCICKSKGIALFDVRGNDLCAEKKAVYGFGHVKGITKEELLVRASRRKAVSFDLFDTLLMRRTVFSSDVLELVEWGLMRQGIVIEDFSKKRLAAEKELSKRYAPSLEEIYSYMKEEFSLPELDVPYAALLEWQTDCGLLVPREEVCEVLLALRAQGKEVYIVTDSYYTKRQLTGLLERSGIGVYTELLVSCEYKTGKAQGLFGVLKERAGTESILHIGDDLYADIESAERNGLEAVQLYSGAELLERSGYLGLWDFMGSLSGRIRMGMFVSRLFNSPFQFEKEGQEGICVNKAYDIGYCFFAPLLADFVLWLHGRIEKEAIQNVFFCARDGYLLQRLYREIAKGRASVYFYTSRRAAVCAGVENEGDLRYVEAMQFGGTLKEELWERFGIAIEESGPAEETPRRGRGGLMQYAETIWERARRERASYQAYIKSLPLCEGPVAFFDFVAKGTSQMYLGRLFQNHLKGFYFLWLEEEAMRGYGLDIEPFYRPEEREESVVFADYYILEAVLTAPEPSVWGFKGTGEPVYAEETRTKEELACIEDVQAGIVDYFRTYLRICPEERIGTDKRLDERVLSLLHRIRVMDERFMRLRVEDPFFNRTTALTDLL